MTADPAEIAGLDGGAYGGVFRAPVRYSRRSTALPRRDRGVPLFTVAFAPKFRTSHRRLARMLWPG
jgi:hypothetical protein